MVQRSIGLDQFAGNLRSVDGDWWRPETYRRDTLTAAQMQSGRKLLRLVSAQGSGSCSAMAKVPTAAATIRGRERWAAVGQWTTDNLSA